MQRLFVILIILLAGGLLVQQSFERGAENTHVRGSVVATHGEAPITRTHELRRGDTIETKRGFAFVEFGDMSVGLAENTQIQLTSPTEMKLIGGRVFVSEATRVDTPWIDVASNQPFSIVNFAWDARVQILPLGASVVVENEPVGEQEISSPAMWSEETKNLAIDETPFNPETSSEAEFYTWVSTF